MLPHFMDRAHLLSRFFLLITCVGWSARSAVPAGQVQQQPSVPAQRPVAPGAQTEAEFSTANTVSIRADSQERDKTVYHLRGHVKVTYKEMKVTADEATYDEDSQEVSARGHIVFTDPDGHLEADEAHYNLRSSHGRFLNAHGFVRTTIQRRPRVLVTENQFYLRARLVERLDQDNFRVEGGRLTACECEHKGWSLATERARVKVGDKMVSHGVVFRLFRVPLFYAPVAIHSIASRPRQTGFLTKNFDAYSFNIYFSRYQNFLCGQPLIIVDSTTVPNPNCPTAGGFRRNDISIVEMPSVSLGRMDQQIGKSPFYFSFETSVAGVRRAEPGFATPK